MKSDELRRLIAQKEDPKLEFKSEFYKIDNPDSKVKSIHWDELIKDVLALTNGCVGRTNDEGHLVIGIGNRLYPDGTRDLYDTKAIKFDSAQILQKINSACHPPLSDLPYERIILDGISILVITLPPSPFLHQTKREMGEHKEYPKHTVFVRRGDSIGTATLEECRAIEVEKKQHAFTNKPTTLSTLSTFHSPLPSLTPCRLYCSQTRSATINLVIRRSPLVTHHWLGRNGWRWKDRARTCRR